MKNRAIKTNDIITGIKRIDDMSDEELADEYRKRVASKEKYIEKNRPVWKQEGIQLREKRTKRKISCNELSIYIGVNPQTIRNLEKGEPVRSRDMMVQSIETASNFILMKRKLVLDRLVYEQGK